MFLYTISCDALINNFKGFSGENNQTSNKSADIRRIFNQACPFDHITIKKIHEY
tara:strand:+ start:730 stop:891 length:162 start_codon:yes stop_codon:yes gene_type:complete